MFTPQICEVLMLWARPNHLALATQANRKQEHKAQQPE